MSTKSRRDSAVSFLKMVVSGKIREAYSQYVAPDFRHHNAYYRGDRESLMIGMEENHSKFPNKKLEVKHTLEDGNMVATYSHVQMKPGELGVIVVHFFRFDKDKVVELWDTGQPIPPDSPNENGVF